MYHNFFIHSSVDGHLGCFHDLAIVNSAAMNIRVHVSFWSMVFSRYMPSSGIAGSYGNSIFILITILLYFIYLFIYLFLPFLLSHVADRVLVLQPGVRPVPLKWESQVQDIGPPETSWLHINSNGKSSPRDLHFNAKNQLHSMTSKLQCWTPYAKQKARQEHNPTH